MTYDANQLTRASAIHMSIRPLLMEVATFWQIGEKRVCTGGHESDGYPCNMHSSYLAPKTAVSVKEKTRARWFGITNQFLLIKEKTRARWFGITNQHLSSDFYDLKHFAHVDCFKWKLNFKYRYLLCMRGINYCCLQTKAKCSCIYSCWSLSREDNCWFVRSLRYYGWSWTTEACLCRSFLDLFVSEVAV